jgi:beta-lactam-binding protein with PASTA domain
LSSYEAALTQANLLPAPTQSEAYSTAPIGNVLIVTPAPGSSQKVDTQVEITVSGGPAPLPIPFVVGKSESTARTLLTTSGFHYTEKQDFSSSVPLGNVIAQDPEPYVNGKPGDTITIDISKGPQLFAVPNVSSTLANPASWVSVSHAESVLTAAGFTVKVKKESGFGIVTSQSPKAGTMYPAGTLITITVH